MRLDSSGVRALLLDIEGTTTPVAFVYEVLFPFVRERVRDFLEQHAEEARADLDLLKQEHAKESGAPLWKDDASAAEYVFWLMDRDRKSTGLKSLQGRIWERGFKSGALHGAVYPDVPIAFERWRRMEKSIAIFSSGSVGAQQNLFSTTAAGDLTRFISAFFDTTTGAKRDLESYRRITLALGLRSPDLLFVSDVVAELDAANAAGLPTALCVREDEMVGSKEHPVIRTFDEVLP